MDLIMIMEMFPDQAACIAYLEQLRWQGSPECPHCESTHINKRNETATGRIGRWNCHDCHSTFKVTLWHNVCWNADRTSEMVSGDRVDGKRKEKSLKLSTCTRFRIETKNSLANNDVYTC